MPSERVQRQIDRLLDEIEAAQAGGDWKLVRETSQEILDLDPENGDAAAFLAAADRREQRLGDGADAPTAPSTQPEATPAPTSFAAGRYEVRRFLGEGGKKRVYLAHDSLLDREVAFALIKMEGLDEAGRQRVENEAKAMGRLGDHPQIVTVYDVGEEHGQPYMVLPLMPGGDVERLIEQADEHRLPLERILELGKEVCEGLEFAHRKGIVHRDLKPGNVWLTADGHAKIGDFGLAVASDRTRLTQAGMMVGTVSYMPPEQAMGGEVGPRSDLYSLGAMLYEMACGRPPFLGDESVAIIGQHLNTPPVAPSWHRPDCPRALEALILRLLEKDPAKRPASATEVGEALSAIVAGAAAASVTEPLPSSPGHDPLYRRTFVGREQELKQLHQAFDVALSGRGSLAMVVGEPGIGKTALCEQLSTYVALRGGKTLVGHCYEEGSLSLPYLPFVEAMRSYVLAREPEGLKSDLGTGAADVARIVSEIRDRFQVELRPSGDPQDDRFRLLQAVSSFLANASSVQPLLIVLEDLHWADGGTIDLLLQVARNLRGARLLLAGTYRDVEVDRSHSLSSALAELRRSGSFLRVPLRGLTVDEVHRMYEQVRGNEVPWSQAELVYRQTEGNPLFVQEVLRYLVEEGFVVREGGRYVPQEGIGVGIPEGLRDVIGRRLSHLSDETNQLLSLASVIGRDFDLDVLQRVAAQSEDEVSEALKEAKAAAVIEERASVGARISYRFAHAFFRQTLYEEMIAPRRIRLHQQVGQALEEVHARRLEEHAAELAEHFSHSSDPGALTKAVEYGELAAKRAVAVYADAEAVRLLEHALEVQEVLDPDDKTKRCDLLVALGGALCAAGEPRRVLDDVAPAALGLAEACADRGRASNVCQLAIAAITGYGAGSAWGTPEAARWAEHADRFAEEGSPARVWADTASAFVRSRRWQSRAAREVAMRARVLARDLGDPVLQWVADEAWLVVAMAYAPVAPDVAAERLALARDLASRPRAGVSAQALAQAFHFMTGTFLQAGLREEAEVATRELEALAERTKRPEQELMALTGAAWISMADGHLDETMALDERTRARAEETGLVQFALYHRTVGGGSRAGLYLGRVETLEYALPGLMYAPDFGQAFEGQTASAVLDQCVSYLHAADPAVEPHLFHYLAIGELALAERQEPAARLVLDYFRDAPLVTSGLFGGPACIPRLLGDLATLLGERAEARAYYEQAFGVCERMRLRPEKALAALGLAELLLAGDEAEQAEAQPHLELAIAEFHEMKMQPSLERALRHRGLLKA